MDYATTIFAVMIGGFIVVTVMMQLLDKTVPKS